MARFKILFTTAIISSTGIILGCASNSSIDADSVPVANELSGGPAETAAVSGVVEPVPVTEAKAAAVTDPEVVEEEQVDEHVTEIKDKNRVVCRREKLTGTRFPRRICMTVAQREEMARESQKWLNSGGFSGNVQSVQDGLVDPKAKN